MTTKVKCVLLDDELPGLTYLKMLCEQMPELEVVKVYNDPARFMKESHNLEFDACILDIEMPGIKGVDVARALTGKQIIFATAYREYAADAFDLDAVDFVQKPVTKDRLHAAVVKMIGRLSRRPAQRHQLQFNTEYGKSLIAPENIAYVTTSEVDSRDKVAVMMDGSSIVLKNISFESLQATLTEDFCRINKRQLISRRIISSFTSEEVVSNFSEKGKTQKFSLSEAYRQQFADAIRKFS